MKLVALSLIVLGSIGLGLSLVKYNQQQEWEHWQAKFKWLVFIGVSSSIVVIGSLILIFSWKDD